MGKTLRELAEQLKASSKKVQLIYAFNGSGKTRLSREFKDLVAPKEDGEEASGEPHSKILYYNAFTEDLFYWDNDLEGDVERKLKIQPNSFTEWVFKEQGQDQNVTSHFQRYTNNKLTPNYNEEYLKDKNDPKSIVAAFSEVSFSIERGDDDNLENIKISKGEESNFIWSVFYSLLEQVIAVLNVVETDQRETDQFDQLEYIFIDDPVSSLDENHLIELAVNVASLIRSSESDLKFIITTHNPLFYNVMHNEFGKAQKYLLEKNSDGSYDLNIQNSDSPFSYHLFLKTKLEQAIQSGQIHKYHFNFLRNILEKTSTFLGYENWKDLLPKTEGGNSDAYAARIINLSSHSKHAGEEVSKIEPDDKRVLTYLINEFNKMYRFQSDGVLTLGGQNA